MKSLPAFILMVLLSIIVFPVDLIAQTKGQFVLSGKVTDSSNEPLAGAKV